ncbi:molybdenum cofactor biosynthesis protein B [Deinococcus taklimakanensis]|uniref:Molybdenum cofactor biosynthesis protein B n=1 Tax=Deinococcus taklimakanensis TaxID=536443 RepID=A0ABW5P660_9DEIO
MTDPTLPSGLASHRAAAPTRVRTAVVTVSDTRTPETDESGQYLVAGLQGAGHEVIAHRIVRDDAVDIRAALVALTREATVVLVTGGTGVSGRDVTVPVVESMLTKPMPGFGELFRMLSYGQVGGAAMFSRAVGGLVRGAAVFCMPGSLNAVQTAWKNILHDQIGHLAYEVQRHGQPVMTAPAAGGAAQTAFGGSTPDAPLLTTRAPAKAAEPALRPVTPLPEAPAPAFPNGLPLPGTGGGVAAGLGRHRRTDTLDPTRPGTPDTAHSQEAGQHPGRDTP